jgi:hypothetical protein
MKYFGEKEGILETRRLGPAWFRLGFEKVCEGIGSAVVIGITAVILWVISEVLTPNVFDKTNPVKTCQTTGKINCTVTVECPRDEIVVSGECLVDDGQHFIDRDGQRQSNTNPRIALMNYGPQLKDGKQDPTKFECTWTPTDNNPLPLNFIPRVVAYCVHPHRFMEALLDELKKR